MKEDFLSQARYFRLVYTGSSKREYYIYNKDKNYIRYWSVYHDGDLPNGLLPLPLNEA